MKKIITVQIALLFLTFSVWAQIPERPDPPRLVNDYAELLTPGQNQKLEEALEGFARETSTQIVVVIVPDLEGYDISDYAFRLGESWGVGQKGKDNGLVIVMKPKTRESKGQVFVATGYGLEGVLPDAVVNRTVVNHEMIPRFKENDYFGGLASGIQVIMDLTRGEYTAEEYQQSVDNNLGGGIPFLVLLALILFAVFGRSRRRRFYSPGSSLPFWAAMGMMSGSGRSSGSFSNFSSGGGGFGGFGGGGFGGGGAGGSW